MDISFHLMKPDNMVWTKGLKSILGKEIVVLKTKVSDGVFEINLLKHVVDYLSRTDSKIENIQKFSILSWIYKLSETVEWFELLELTSDGESFVSGCEYSYGLISSQKGVCEHLKVAPKFARTDQMVALTDDVLNGVHNIDAVRYLAPEHMSGWWITSDNYDGNVSSLKTVHMGHVLAVREDLRPFLALPPGYRIRVEDEVDVWLDPDVLDEGESIT